MLTVKNVINIKVLYNQYVSLCIRCVRTFESVRCPVLWGTSRLCAVWRRR